MRVLKLALVLFIGCYPPSNPLLAEPIYGYDVLGVAKYCSTFLQAPRLPAMSTLMNTFGNPLPCVEKRAMRGELSDVQIDLIDCTCWRNGTCPPGVPRCDDLKIIEARAREVNVTAGKFPNVTFWASPGLEHDVKDCKRVSLMLQAAQKGCPRCELIQSPFSGCVVPGVPLEKHGNQVKADSVSNDGQSLFDANTFPQPDPKKAPDYRTNGKRFVFGWINEFNGRVSGEKGKPPPPMQRTCWPTRDLMREVYLNLMPPEPEQPAPKTCKSVRSLKEKEIWKTHAETYSPCPHPDKRGNKYLLISKYKDQQMSLIRPDGKEVGCLKYYGSFAEPGYQRHYIGTCSPKTPAQVYDAAGGENLFVKRNNGECLRVNTIRRLGIFR